jgi:hypothetical protein
MADLRYIEVSVPLAFAAALQDAQFTLMICPGGLGSDGYDVTTFNNCRPPLRRAVIAELLRRTAAQYAGAGQTESSPDRGQGISTPAAAVAVGAAGVVSTLHTPIPARAEISGGDGTTYESESESTNEIATDG